MGCAIFGAIVTEMPNKVHETLPETWFRSWEWSRDS